MKKTKKKNNKTQKKSRHIPKAVAKAVNQKHFFECAWCCTKITEKHHITEFSNGGEHTVENLILLCSNCHTEVHNKTGKINEEDLLKRKSTHLKGDRLAGNLVFELKSNLILLGELSVQGFKNILSFKKVPVISFEFDEEREEYYLNCKIYNKNGDLVFWLSKNRYWAISSFNINANKDTLEITNDKNDNYYLKFWLENGKLRFIGKSYHKNNIFEVNSSEIKIGNDKNNQRFSGDGTLISDGGNLINM